MSTATVRDIMHRFTERTGVVSGAAQQRYLWTDAFAVCNLLELHRSGEDTHAEARALALIDAVHQTLGRHRTDDGRTGWISGLPAGEARDHPAAGGLRIGKPLPERRPDEPPDAEREWEQDGQYFHYLTRWMHALDQAAWHTGDRTFNRWACELADTAFRAFSYVPAPDLPRRMYWKMSIDLSRPLVPAMGLHDPLDGYVTFLQLCTSAAALPEDPTDAGPDLTDATRKLADMVSGGGWATDDPLGLGGLMCDAHRLLQIEHREEPVPETLLPTLLSDIRSGFAYLSQAGLWTAPPERRLAFRELGLAIGIRAMEALYDAAPVKDRRGLQALLAPVMEQRRLAEQILEFWLDPVSQASPTWTGHLDINETMLATAIAPAGYIDIDIGAGRRTDRS